MTATLLVASLLIAIVGPLLAAEIKAWSCWLRQKLRRMAVAKLPKKCRDRYDEEWESGIEEIPGQLFKLIYAIGLLRAAAEIRNAATKGAVRHETTLASLLKRTLDIAFSSLVLLVVSPLLLAIAILIKLDSPGSVFYSSERVGKKGRIFRCFKFRTMVRDAEKRRADVMHMNERDGVLFKISNDPRVTALGRFLRKYSLDEVPQFLNVLLGDMSVVGPRPPLASEVKEYKLSHLRRLDVTPGITGLWQVQARQDPSFDSYISLDLAYIEKQNMWLDVKIILRTVGVMLAGTGS
jgi:lipopolysaccharide/colanic/teichoic acid biosynthesis glycosyltransferase